MQPSGDSRVNEMNFRKCPGAARGVAAIRKTALYPWVLIVALLSFASAGMAQPIITDFSPKAGAAGDIITLTGTGFTSGAVTVYFWNGVQAAIIFISRDLQMTVQVPNGASTWTLSIQ